MNEQSEIPAGHFFLPGPTEVRQVVLDAQAGQMIGHRGAEIQALMREIQEGLKALFITERPVIVSASSATGLMEAGVRNGVAGGRVLSLVNGAFSGRFAEISRACGHDTDVWEVAWGSVHDPEELAARLASGRYDAVTLSQSETSTGALQDLESIAGVVSHLDGVLLLVDSVTGIGGVEVATDAWGLDWVVTGSQKAMALPPGMSFGVASPAMMSRSAKADHKGYYFDLVELERYLERFETPATPAVSLLYSLRLQLDRMREEGIEARWKRHAAMQARTLDWIEDMQAAGAGIGVLAGNGHRSPTVTCVTMPDGVDGKVIVERLLRRGWVIGSGYGPLKDSTVRIGHMGDHTLAELDGLLEVLGEVLR